MSRRFLAVVALAVLLAAAPGRAEDFREELDFVCGSIVTSNQSWQFGMYAWVEYLVETRGLLNLCGQWIVAVDAFIAGVPHSGASSGTRFLTATVRRQIPVPYYGFWTTTGQHWATTSFWPGLVWAGGSSSRAEVVPPRRGFDPEYSCYEIGGTWDGSTCEVANTPVIVDTNRDGYRLTGVEDGVRFDLNADGMPELVAWTEADTDEAFLVMDRNGNGLIDDGTELFGNHTPAYADRTDVTTANGFEALRFLEGPSYGGGARNNVIDALDAAFARLFLWTDRNHNGISEPEELQPIAQAGLVAISTEYKVSSRKDRHGNEFRQRAMAVWADGQQHYVYDVWLRSRN